MFIIIVFILFILAFLLSLRSLRSELRKNIKTHEVAASLAKGRVLFIADASKEQHERPHAQEMPTVQEVIPPVSPVIPSHASEQQTQSLSEVRDQLSQLKDNSQQSIKTE